MFFQSDWGIQIKCKSVVSKYANPNPNLQDS